MMMTDYDQYSRKNRERKRADIGVFVIETVIVGSPGLRCSGGSSSIAIRREDLLEDDHYYSARVLIVTRIR